MLVKTVLFRVSELCSKQQQNFLNTNRNRYAPRPKEIVTANLCPEKYNPVFYFHYYLSLHVQIDCFLQRKCSTLFQRYFRLYQSKFTTGVSKNHLKQQIILYHHTWSSSLISIQPYTAQSYCPMKGTFWAPIFNLYIDFHSMSSSTTTTTTTTTKLPSNGRNANSTVCYQYEWYLMMSPEDVNNPSLPQCRLTTILFFNTSVY